MTKQQIQDEIKRLEAKIKPESKCKCWKNVYSNLQIMVKIKELKEKL